MAKVLTEQSQKCNACSVSKEPTKQKVISALEGFAVFQSFNWCLVKSFKVRRSLTKRFECEVIKILVVTYPACWTSDSECVTRYAV